MVSNDECSAIVDWVLTGGWIRIVILAFLVTLIVAGPVCLAVYVDRCYELSARASLAELASAIAAVSENLASYKGPYTVLAREQLDRAVELYREAAGDMENGNWMGAEKTAQKGLTLVEAVQALTTNTGGNE